MLSGKRFLSSKLTRILGIRRGNGKRGQPLFPAEKAAGAETQEQEAARQSLRRGRGHW